MSKARRERKPRPSVKGNNEKKSQGTSTVIGKGKPDDALRTSTKGTSASPLKSRPSAPECSLGMLAGAGTSLPSVADCPPLPLLRPVSKTPLPAPRQIRMTLPNGAGPILRARSVKLLASEKAGTVGATVLETAGLLLFHRRRLLLPLRHPLHHLHLAGRGCTNQNQSARLTKRNRGGVLRSSLRHWRQLRPQPLLSWLASAKNSSSAGRNEKGGNN